MVRFIKILPFSSLQGTFSIWISYGVRREDINIFRTNLLLRSLIADSNPFQDILLSCFDYFTSLSQQRFVFLLLSRGL